MKLENKFLIAIILIFASVSASILQYGLNNIWLKFIIFILLFVALIYKIKSEPDWYTSKRWWGLNWKRTIKIKLIFYGVLFILLMLFLIKDYLR